MGSVNVLPKSFLFIILSKSCEEKEAKQFSEMQKTFQSYDEFRALLVFPFILEDKFMKYDGL